MTAFISLRRWLLASLLGLALALPVQAQPATDDDLPPPPAARQRPVTVEVLRVKDGDTFEFKVPGDNALDLTLAVRVRGINAPEMHSGCGLTDDQIAKLPEDQRRAARDQREALRHAERARARIATVEARRLIAESGNRVTLRNYSNDKYGGRIDAEVSLADGRDFAQAMLALGHVDAYDGRGPRQSWCGR